MNYQYGITLAYLISFHNGKDIEEMSAHLEKGERITLFCGAGCEGAHDEVVELAKRLQAPVVHAFRGKEWVGMG